MSDFMFRSEYVSDINSLKLTKAPILRQIFFSIQYKIVTDEAILLLCISVNGHVLLSYDILFY